MPNTNAPRGFKPRKDAIGSAWSSTLNSYPLASGSATPIYTGDVVKLLTTGYIAKAAPGDQMRGVAAGFRWTGPDGRTVSSPFWPGGQVTQNAKDAQVLVQDDPNTVFEAQFTNAATIPGPNVSGKTFNLFDAGGVNATGLSGEGIDLATQGTGAQQFRCIGFATRPHNDTTATGGAYSYGLFVPALHDFRVNTGI